MKAIAYGIPVFNPRETEENTRNNINLETARSPLKNRHLVCYRRNGESSNFIFCLDMKLNCFSGAKFGSVDS